MYFINYKKYINQQNIVIFFLLLSLVAISLLNASLIFYEPINIVQAQVDTFNSRISFWENFQANHPTYLEGWIELSNLYIQNGNKNKALAAYENAFKINPNSEKLISLRLKLSIY